MTLHFEILEEPTGKGRPIVTNSGHAFTPKRTVNYETRVQLEFQRQCPRQRFGDDQQLRMIIEAYYGVAKSDSKRKRQAKLDGMIRPTKKPDCDNVGKIIADALNGIAYRDDAQIVSMIVEKYYSAIPRVEVTIEEARHEGLLD